MFLDVDKQLKVNITHSHTKTVLAEQRFHSSSKIFEVKNFLCKKYGTLPEYMKLKLLKKDQQPIFIIDEEKCLGDFSVEDYDTIHVIDSNPNSVMVQNNFDDVSTVNKYEISEVDYEKRNDTVRKFRQKLAKDPDYLKMIQENKGNNYEEEASKIELNSRCQLGDGISRGEVKFVGLVIGYGYGFYVGVKLDEPTGDNDGTYKGKKYFDCDPKYGCFVRPDYLQCGDFPPIDVFNELEDEI